MTRLLPALIVLTALLACGLLACGPDLEPLPDPPDLAAVDESVRRQYEQLRAELEGLGGDASKEQKASAHGRLGLFFHAYRQPEAAELAYGNALALEPTSQRWSYYRGLLHGQAGRTEAALGDFTIAARSGQEAALVRLAETEVELGAVESAIARLEPIVAASSRNVRARAILARALTRGDAPAESARRRAAALLEEALREQADASSLRYQLASLYRELGDDVRARGHLAQIDSAESGADIALLMSDPWGRELDEMDVSYLGHLQRGRRATARERHQEALRHFGAALEVDPERFAARFAAAKAWLGLGRDSEARRLCRRLLEDFPDKSEVHLLQGRLYRRDADPRAVAAFARAVELDPQSLPALRQLAAEKRRSGDLVAAAELLGRARQIAPGATKVLLSLADILVELQRESEAEAMLEEALPTAKERWAIELRLEKLRGPGA